nr:prohibitin-1, mitochondrial-like [Coffea arabica]
MDKLKFDVPKLPGWVSALIKVGVLGGGQRAAVFNRIVGVKRSVSDILHQKCLLKYADICCFILSTKDCKTIIMMDPTSVYPEGTHFLIPWFERPTIYDVRARPYIVEGTSGSHDLQTVNIALRILTRPVADQLPTIYRSLGENFNERVLPSIVHETLKAVVTQYNASQLITQRETVSQEIRSLLIKRAASFNIALDDVSITSLTFGREFTAAIEANQIAAQEAGRAKFVVEKAEQEKKSAIIRAQGEAASAELIGKATAENPSFIKLRRIEASKDVAQTISNSANRVYLNSDDLLLNLQGMNLSTSSLIEKMNCEGSQLFLIWGIFS